MALHKKAKALTKILKDSPASRNIVLPGEDESVGVRNGGFSITQFD